MKNVSMIFQKTCIGSFLFTRCSCGGLEVVRRTSSAYLRLTLFTTPLLGKQLYETFLVIDVICFITVFLP